MGSLENLLIDGLAVLGLEASVEQRAQLLDFVRLMGKWNRVYNLTAIDAPEDMVRLHLLDSLAILPYLEGSRILDVGTGAGLPGIPLAIMAPEREFTLLDSNAKKARFVRQAAIELNLKNVSVAQARIEQYAEDQIFDAIVSRAYASLGQFVEQTRRLLRAGGVILAQKGKLPDGELRELTGLDVTIQPLSVPGVDAERHLIAIKLRDNGWRKS